MNEQMEEEWFGEGYQIRKINFWIRWFESLNNRRTLSKLSYPKTTAKRLLEIGVGSGSFLIAAKSQGYDVMGCDLSEPICNQVEKYAGIKMFCGPLIELQGSDHFDVIVMNHVLEHVQDPVLFLKEVQRLLVPGGIVHIALPNINCWEANFRGWTSYEPYHMSYFSIKTLSNAVTSSGLILESISTHESFSGWFLVIIRSILGFNRKEGAVTRTISLPIPKSNNRTNNILEHAYRILMVIVGALSFPFRWIQGRLGFGDELICVATKTYKN